MTKSVCSWKARHVTNCCKKPILISQNYNFSNLPSQFFVCQHKNLHLLASVRQIVLIHRKLANKAQKDILKSSIARYFPTRPNLVVNLSEFTTH